VFSDPGVDLAGAFQVPVQLGGPPNPQGCVGFAHVAVQARRNAITYVGRATLGLWSYVIDCCGVVTAVGAAVVPGRED
jgi:hypothetical protein